MVRHSKPRLMTSSSAGWNCNIRMKPIDCQSISLRWHESARRNADKCRATNQHDGWSPLRARRESESTRETSAWDSGQRAEEAGSAPMTARFPGRNLPTGCSIQPESKCRATNVPRKIKSPVRSTRRHCGKTSTGGKVSYHICIFYLCAYRHPLISKSCGPSIIIRSFPI